jgi:prolyl-tRNA synthetase
VVLDSSIETSEAVFAIHAGSSSDTVFISGKDLASYLKSLETADTKVREIDFTALKAEATAPTPAPAASKGENPIQIAIGAKKDEDFATWYTDVNLLWDLV